MLSFVVLDLWFIIVVVFLVKFNLFFGNESDLNNLEWFGFVFVILLVLFFFSGLKLFLKMDFMFDISFIVFCFLGEGSFLM